MCKHVAAVLHGVGARLDHKPELLFVLRGVDENDLLARAGSDLSLVKAAPTHAKVLGDGDATIGQWLPQRICCTCSRLNVARTLRAAYRSGGSGSGVLLPVARAGIDLP
jgi:uncharacterized Zn finger protein